MIIAVDTSIITYALKYALENENAEAVNYICQRLIETVPQMQRTLAIWCIQDIEDYLKTHDPEYIKLKPIQLLLEVLKSHRKEFRA